MQVDPIIKQRLIELEQLITQVGRSYKVSDGGFTDYDRVSFQEWATSALGLLQQVFGEKSIYFKNFQNAYTRNSSPIVKYEECKGIFLAAKVDYEGGFIFRLENALSGEILGDFVTLAKATLKEGNKDAAAVLASAALEDALKRYARQNELAVDDKEMQAVVGALKSKGLVLGAQKTLLDTMPKLRDYAMHANWDKLTSADVGSIIGFVEQFLLSHFS